MNINSVIGLSTRINPLIVHGEIFMPFELYIIFSDIYQMLVYDFKIQWQ